MNDISYAVRIMSMVIITNYCTLYAKQYIYLEKLKVKNKCTSFNGDFLGYLSHLKFDKYNIIYENL